jgi:exodeoxyribonuclease VII large subunit
VAAAIVDHNHLVEQQLLQLAESMEDGVTALLWEKQQWLDRWTQQMQYAVPNKMALRRQKLLQWQQLINTGSERILHNKTNHITQWQARLESGTVRYLRILKNMLMQQERLVDQLSPQTILKRGFAIAEQNGKIITDAGQVNPTLPLTTRLAHARIESTIIKIETDE